MIAGPVRPLVATESSLTGSLNLHVSPLGWSVIAVSETEFRDGSPLMVKNDGTNLSLVYLPRGSGSFIRQVLSDLKYADNSSGSVTSARVFSLRGIGPEAVFLSVTYSGITVFYYGLSDFSGNMAWASSYTHAGTVKDVIVVLGNGVFRPAFLDQSANAKVLYGTFPTFNGSTWTGPSIEGVPTTVDLSTMSTGIGFARCGVQPVVAGLNSSNYFQFGDLLPAPPA